jgi:tetratricopeptide (TPR) repeat protein
MSMRLIVRGFTVGAVALFLATWATPALAQGAIKGRILDEKNHPAPGVQVMVTCTSVSNVQPQGITTDSDGRFTIQGLVFGTWTLVAQQGNLVAKPKGPLSVMPNIMTDAGDLSLKPDASAVAVKKNAPAAKGVSPEEAAAANKLQKELEAKFKGANEDIAAGNYDDAITKLSAVAKEVGKDPKNAKNSAACSAKLGEVYGKKAEADKADDQKKLDLAEAEKYFLEAISFDATTVDAYNALAAVYNAQGKYDDAIKMSAKAKELTAAAGGSQNPTAAYNEGVMLWNAGKFEEAEAAFKKASELDPKNANAFYQLGMTQVNLGKLPEAVKAFETYLTLSPKGPEAENAKAMLLAIKK